MWCYNNYARESLRNICGKESVAGMIYDLQKAEFWKRVSAFIFDKILVFIVAAGFAFLLSAILNMDAHSEKINERTEYYSDSFGIDITMTEEDYNKLSDADKTIYNSATAAFEKDEAVGEAMYMIFNLTLITVTFSVLVAYAILELAVPLFLKNGQTLGKKIFGIGVMRVDGVRVTAPIMFIRTILGKCTIEVLVPIMAFIGMYFIPQMFGLTGPIIILAVLITTVAMTIATKTRSPIHDMFAGTVTVDMSSQLIFDTAEELLAYKQRLHAEIADKSDY